MDERTAFDVADWELERYRLGELPPEAVERVRRALDARADSRARLESLARADAEHLDAHPPAVMAHAIRARLARAQEAGAGGTARRRAATLSVLRPAVAAALGVGLLAVGLALLRPDGQRSIGAGGTSGPTHERPGDGNLLKGLLPHLIVFRRVDGGPDALPSGARVRRGDVVQIAYQAAGRRYGMIASVDGRGSLTLHLPAEGSQAAALEGGGVVALDRAFALDDAPLFERFYFVTSGAPFELAPVLAALRAAHENAASPAPPHLPQGLDLSLFILNKETPS